MLMKREIKFRAWDTERLMFVPDGEIIFSFYGETNIEVNPNCLEYVGDSCHNGEPQRSRFVVMQYTGLKDKNGKEIYEGDIIKIIEGNYPLSWWIEYSNIHAGFVRKWKRDKNDLFPVIYTDFKTDIIEVIGNIYENPELLNQ